MHCCKYFLPDICNVVMNSLSCMFYSLTFAIIILPKSFYAVCLSCVYLTRIVLHLFLVSFKYWNPSFSIVFPYGHWRLENHCILSHHENMVKWLQNHLKILKFDLCEHHLRLMAYAGMEYIPLNSNGENKLLIFLLRCRTKSKQMWIIHLIVLIKFHTSYYIRPHLKHPVLEFLASNRCEIVAKKLYVLWAQNLLLLLIHIQWGF